MLLNKVHYDPVDDDSDSGFRRPPRDPKAINDYFHTIGGIEDNGRFAASEMKLLLEKPHEFFGEKTRPVGSAELAKDCKRLSDLLTNPEPGLSSWHESCERVAARIRLALP